MKIINVNPGLLPIPPNGWGAVEKIIWEYHQSLLRIGLNSEIKYTDEVKYDDSVIVHVHVANLANMLHERGIPYIFSIHDHHAYLYGKDSNVFKENLLAIENSVISLSPGKFLLPYFGSKKLRYFSHAVNTETFFPVERPEHNVKRLLCVANNGYAYDGSKDRKGFAIAIEAAKLLNLPITVAGPSNNKKFFDTLPKNLNEYSGLTKLFDLNEEELIRLYRNHDAFLHFSELEAGHPNLTLLEAMACGLPVVGTFESSIYEGMYVSERSVDGAVKGIQSVLSSLKEYRNLALNNASNNSYTKKVIELTKIYTEYKDRIFANQLVSYYNNTTKTFKEVTNTATYTFTDGPKVEILGPVKKKYKVKFIDTDTGVVAYETIIENNMWSSCHVKYFCRWKIEVYEVLSENWDVVFSEHCFDPTNKDVKVVLDTQSLGDIIAFIGAVEEFRKKHKCKMTCVVFSEPLKKLLTKSYSDIRFESIDQNNHLYYAVYKIGYFDSWQGHLRVNPKRISLAHISSHILGLGDVEFVPTIKFDRRKIHSKKYVCIFTQSTSQAKYWNNKNGWGAVIKYLKFNGYDVWCIDRYNSFGNGKNMNYIPEGAIDKTGDFSLEERLNQIYHAEFCIGLSSGLSWLAWAIGKPIVLISGFTEAFNEFSNPHRVINTSVCNGCWNDVRCEFDKGDWMWCPRKKDFECTKEIRSTDVIKIVNKLI